MKKITAEALKKAIYKALASDVLSEVVRMDPAFDGMDREQLDRRLEEEAGKLATEELLDWINGHMEMFPAAKLRAGGIDYSGLIAEDEEAIGHNVRYTTKLFDEPVCYMGGWMDSMGSCTFNYYSGWNAFLTADGEWKTAYSFTVTTDNPGDKARSEGIQFETYEPLDDPEWACYCMDEVAELLPDFYKGKLYDNDPY